MATAVLVPILTYAGVSAGTAATIGAVVSTVGTVLTVGSVVGSALGSAKAAQTQASATTGAANFNQQVAAENANITQGQTDQQVRDVQRTQYLQRSTNTANAGGSGLGLTGSSLDILSDNASQNELDVLNTKYQGALTVRGYNNSAALDVSQAKNADIAGQIGVGTSILGGVTNLGKVGANISFSSGSPANSKVKGTA